MAENSTDTTTNTNPRNTKKVGMIYSGMSGGTVANTNIYSRMRITHEGLMSRSMANEMNTYRTWSSFNLAVDADGLTQDDFKDSGVKDEHGEAMYELKKPGERKKVESTGVRSIFNKLHAVGLDNETYAVRLSQNSPLLDSPNNRRLQRAMNSCTVRDLVQKSHQGMLGAAMYEYSDFMYCKYLGRIPNNYLITLRRYALPVNDYVKPYGNPAAIKGTDITSTQTDNGGIPLGTMVTWLGAPGNEMSNILKYNFSMPFKSVDSKLESDGLPENPARSTSNTSKSLLGGGFNKAFGNQAFQRMGNYLMPGIYNKRGGQSDSYPGPHYDPNKVYGGVDMIKSVYIRDDKGLQFNHEFKLVFDYELKSYDGINGKQAMLDLLGNILTVCYTTGDFWPGAYQHTAGSTAYQPMSSLECMKHHNTFSGYVNAFQKDFQTAKGRFKSLADNPVETIKGLLNDLGGLLLGGDLEALPPRIKSGMNQLLSDTTVGLWHVTIGNPCSPILCMGNLILKDTEVEHYGPLGIDDFPTGLKVTCTFTHGKPRDKRLIERMYGSGNDRIYMPLDQSVCDMLNKATAITNKMAGDSDTKQPSRKTNGGQLNADDPGNAPDKAQLIAERNASLSSALSNALGGASATVAGGRSKQIDAIEELNQADLIKRVFGLNNTQALKFSSGELAEGVQVAPKKDITKT